MTANVPKSHRKLLTFVLSSLLMPWIFGVIRICA
jgi:hypothetical protein